MSNCCSSKSDFTEESIKPEVPTLCPLCGQKGLKVKPLTLQSLLTVEEASDFAFEGFRFCRTQGCQVAYFGLDETLFTTEQVKVPIYQKDLNPEVYVCYCFKVSRGEVVASVGRGEGSQTYDQVKQKKDTSGWDCEAKNPQGNCCFGNLKDLIQSAQ